MSVTFTLLLMDNSVASRLFQTDTFIKSFSYKVAVNYIIIDLLGIFS